MPHKYARLRETVFDLYIERDRVHWGYKVGAYLSSWLALGGYILFALVFSSDPDNLKIPPIALTALAGTLLVVGYACTTIIALRSRSLLFCFDAVLLPILTSSFMGVFVIVMNHALHRNFDIPNQGYIYGPLITASLTTIASAVLTVWVYIKMRKVQDIDGRIRQRVPRWERQSLSHGPGGDAASTMELLPLSLPEDEAQRRQLLRLLLQREAERSERPSSTYRIDLPGESPSGQVQYLSVPAGGSDGDIGSARPRSGSMPANPRRISLGDLLGKSKSPEQPQESNIFKDPRQRRRDEIERLSLYSPSITGTPRSADFGV